MSDLFWPGDERAGSLMSSARLLAAMTSVEAAWLEALVDTGVAPVSARHPLSELVGDADLDALARGAEAAGNPVLGLVELLRSRVGAPDAASWLHRGLTSQDVLDTALVLTLVEVLDELLGQLSRQAVVLGELVRAHRASAMVGRTLTQHAVPITFGLKASTWLSGVLDAADAITAVRARAATQLGGAAGTLAAPAELARVSGRDDPPGTAWRLVEQTALAIGLAPRTPWHTNRSWVSAAGDALVGCTDAWGHLAADVATLSRPEIAELAEGSPAGGPPRGGSSTMPGKRNPILAVLVRRAALTGPPLAATLHLAAATTVDERPDGAWHAEWAALRDLARRTVVAGSQTTELLAGLQIDSDRMRATLEGLGQVAEQQSMAKVAGGEPRGDYLGAAQLLIDRVLDRSRAFTAGAP